MDFSLNDDQRMLADTLGRFLQDNYPIEKRHESAASPEGFSREVWTELGELGMAGALFPESAGGFGGSGQDIAIVFEALGRALVVEPFLPTLFAGGLLAELDGDGKHQSLIEKTIAGDSLLAFAHGEPDAHYDLENVATAAEKNGQGEWQISGRKSVVLGGGSADQLIVSARTSGETESTDGISLFLVDPASGDVEIRNYGTVDGYAAAEISLNGAKGELLGEEGKALGSIEKAHARAIVAVSAEALGAMEVAKDFTVEYMHQRKQFGVPIGKFQALQHRMADVLIELEQLRSAIKQSSMQPDIWRQTARCESGKFQR